MNRKLIIRIAGAITLALLILYLFNLASCGVDSDQRAYLKSLSGSWVCAETTLEDPDCKTGYLGLWIPTNGRFAMYDKENGKPGIAGHITSLNASEMTLSCTESDFTPPAGWEKMSLTQTIQYELISDHELHLTFTDGKTTSTLVFKR